jgi:DNA-binding protein H-NS
MDKFLKLVTNRNSLKSLVKDFYMDELQKFSSNLTIIIEQRENQEVELRKKHKQKIQKIEEIQSLLNEQGLSVDDLIGNPLDHILKPTKAKKKLSPKYRLVDLDGTTYEWTGRGITPRVFQQHFDRGHSKESCLIINNIKI